MWLRHSVVPLQHFTFTSPMYLSMHDDAPLMAEEDLLFESAAARACSCSAARRGRRPGDDDDDAQLRNVCGSESWW